MSDPLTSLFSNSYNPTSRNSLVYLEHPSDTSLFKSISEISDDAMLDRLSHYHCSKLISGTPEYAAFVERYPLAFAPSFHLLNDNIQRVFAPEDTAAQFWDFLQQEKGISEPALTEAGNPNDLAATSDSKVTLSIRLPSGEKVRGTFEATNTLKYVGRWLEREHNVVLGSESSSTSGYTSCVPEPLRHAFFCPGSRVTFCEGQEFCQLKSLGLSPRLVLILKPEYDARALEAHANYSTLSAVQLKVTSMLQALYSFFDYGVDDAQRDLQSITHDIPIPVPGFLPMDPANKTSNPIVAPTLQVAEEAHVYDHNVEVGDREGTPVPGRLEVAV